jgi:hypothetical protein
LRGRLASRLARTGSASALCALAACTEPQLERSIPAQGEWVDHGVALPASAPGSWDALRTGMVSPCAAIQREGLYLLYYVGADGARGDPWTDGGPRHRKLGVATSRDGLRFEPHPGNPVIASQRHPPNQEEGVFSCAATLDPSGGVVLYFGEMEAQGPASQLVDGDAVLATSRDGLAFTVQGDVLRHDDPELFGHGDEIFPVGVLQHGGQWQVYYIAKGREADWDIGVARGAEPGVLGRSALALDRFMEITGSFQVQRLGTTQIAVIFDERLGPLRMQEARVGSIREPARLGARVRTYRFPGLLGSVSLLDHDGDRWLMYYVQSGDQAIRVKSAPARSAGLPSPTAPRASRFH